MIPPEPMPGVQPWLVAFWELRTERLFAEGPIPASAIRSYPVAPGERDDFDEAMRAADAAVLEILSKPPGQRGEALPVATPAVLRKKA